MHLNTSTGRSNRFLNCLTEGSIAFGTLIALPEPAIVEIVGYAGYDFAILDMEHGPADFQTIEHMVRAAQFVGITPLVRVGELSPNWILRALETGAQGIVLPHLCTPQDATAAVRATRFHPVGERGVCRATRPAQYSAKPIAEHVRESNENVIVMGLIEDARAINLLHEIVNTAGLTAIMPGPVDLSQSLGYSGEVETAEVKEVISKVFSIAATSPCAAGAYITRPSDVRRCLELGAKFIVYSMPARVLLEAYRSALEDMQESVLTGASK